MSESSIEVFKLVIEAARLCIWPGVAIWAALHFKPELRAILNLLANRMQSFEFEYSKLKFAIRILEASAVANNALPPPTVPDYGAAPTELADSDPDAAVIQSWKKLEAAAEQMIQRANVQGRSGVLKLDVQHLLTARLGKDAFDVIFVFDRLRTVAAEVQAPGYKPGGVLPLGARAFENAVQKQIARFESIS